MPDDEQKIVRVIPPDLKPLTDEEFEDAMDVAFWRGYDMPGMPEQGNTTSEDTQRIMITLIAERQNVARLRHWVAMAGSNASKPTAEAKVSFIAMSAALDLIMGGPDDIATAISLLNTAVTQVALSQAGKLDLDLVEWAARDLDIQKNKPMFNNYGEFHDLKGDPMKSGAVEHHPRQGPPVHVYDTYVDGAVEVCKECGLLPGQLKGPHCITCGRTNGGG
jgi:hypothetical protein